jgi:hypothetical protein
MKKVLLLIILSQVVLRTSAQITFEKVFYTKTGSLSPGAPAGINGNPTPVINSGKEVQQTSDGGYICLSIEKDTVDGDINSELTKVDKYGDLQWEQKFGGNGVENATSLAQTSGGYVFTGSTNGFGHGGQDVMLVKTDNSGTELWTKTYGDTLDEEGASVRATTDGGYIIAGRTSSFGAGGMDVYLIKTDSNGVLTWSKTFGGSGDERATCVRETADGGFIITGFTNSFGAGNDDVYIIKTDAAGNAAWTKTVGEADWEEGNAGIQTADGAYMIAGTSRSFGTNNDMYLIKMDVDGNVSWTKTLGGVDNESAFSLVQSADMGYAVLGAKNAGPGTSDLYFVKTDSTGTILWSRTFGNAGNDAGASVAMVNDGGFILFGKTEDAPGDDLAFLIKTDGSGSTSCTSVDAGSADAAVISSFSTPANSMSFDVSAFSYATATELPDTLDVKISTMCFSEVIAVNPGTPLAYYNATMNGLTDSAVVDAPVDSTEAIDTAGYYASKSMIAAAAEAHDFTVYPNPNDGSHINFAVSGNMGEEMIVVVYDVMGRQNFSKVLVMSDDGNNVFAIDPDNKLQPGVYMITATSGKTNFSKTLIVK